MLRELDVFSDQEVTEIERIRRIRNYLVHGIEVPDAEFIQQTGAAIQQIIERLASDSRPDVKQAAERARRLDEQ